MGTAPEPGRCLRGHHDIHPSDPASGTPSSIAVSGLAIWRLAPARLPAVHLGAPDLAFGGATLWTTQQTPELRWSDGTPTGVRLKPLRVTANGREMVFEWTSQTDTWVDFANLGFENGTFESPFNSLAEGLAAASHGGTLKLKAGIGTEHLTLSKRVTLEAVGGPVTVR